MMASTLDLVIASVAIVLQPGASPEALKEDDLTGFLSRPILIGQTSQGGFVISSQRDQTEVQLFSNKVDVRNLSGDVAKAQSKIPGLVWDFIRLTKEPKILTYGINFIVEVAEPKPREWIGTHFIRPGVLGQDHPLSNSAAIIANVGNRTWTVRFEERKSPTGVTINFNASINTSDLPEAKNMSSDIGEQYDMFTTQLRKLGLPA